MSAGPIKVDETQPVDAGDPTPEDEARAQRNWDQMPEARRAYIRQIDAEVAALDAKQPLKEFNPNHDERGRFASGGAVEPDWTAAAQSVAAHGGGTFDPRTGTSPTTGYQVALQGATKQYDQAVLDNPEEFGNAIHDFVQANAAAFKANSSLYAGAWVQDGKVWLEPSENIADQSEAIAAGTARDQISIWDNANGVEIPTGGSGGL